MKLAEIKAAAVRVIEAEGRFPIALTEDTLAVADFVRAAAARPPMAIRVDYTCSRTGRTAGLSAMFDEHGNHQTAAAEFIERVNKRPCCTITRVVHVLGVEVEVGP